MCLLNGVHFLQLLLASCQKKAKMTFERSVPKPFEEQLYVYILLAMSFGVHCKSLNIIRVTTNGTLTDIVTQLVQSVGCSDGVFFAWTTKRRHRALHVLPTFCNTCSGTIKAIRQLWVAETTKINFKHGSQLLGPYEVEIMAGDCCAQFYDEIHLLCVSMLENWASSFPITCCIGCVTNDQNCPSGRFRADFYHCRWYASIICYQSYEHHPAATSTARARMETMLQDQSIIYSHRPSLQRVKGSHWWSRRLSC